MSFTPKYEQKFDYLFQKGAQLAITPPEEALLAANDYAWLDKIIESGFKITKEHNAEVKNLLKWRANGELIYWEATHKICNILAHPEMHRFFNDIDRSLCIIVANKIDCLERLLAAGADPRLIVNEKEETVLHLLDCTFSVEWWKLLKEKCNLTAQDWFNKGTFYQTPLAKHLEKCGSDNCPLLVVFPELASQLNHFPFARKRKSSMIGDHSGCYVMNGAGSCITCDRRANLDFSETDSDSDFFSD